MAIKVSFRRRQNLPEPLGVNLATERRVGEEQNSLLFSPSPTICTFVSQANLYFLPRQRSSPNLMTKFQSIKSQINKLAKIKQIRLFPSSPLQFRLSTVSLSLSPARRYAHARLYKASRGSEKPDTCCLMVDVLIQNSFFFEEVLFGRIVFLSWKFQAGLN